METQEGVNFQEENFIIACERISQNSGSLVSVYF